MGLLNCTNQQLTFTDEQEVGGQTFNKFPETDAEVAQFWSEVWDEMAKDMIVPAMVIPPIVAKELFASTMEGLVAVPGGGLAAMSAAAVAAFNALSLAIAPNLIVSPPPVPFLAVLAPAMAPFLLESLTGPGPAPPPSAAAWAGALAAWIALGLWTVPGPPAPAPFTTAP